MANVDKANRTTVGGWLDVRYAPRTGAVCFTPRAEGTPTGSGPAVGLGELLCALGVRASDAARLVQQWRKGVRHGG